MLTIIVFIAVLAVLVLTHEVGHFIAARRCGMAVEEFGFGFPPRIFGVQIWRKNKLEKISEREEIKVEITERPMADGSEVIEEKITDEKKEIDIVVPERRWRFVFGNRDLTPEDGSYGTIYSLNWFPLGGFVRVKGENGESFEPDSFMAQGVWKKAIFIVAGVLMNIVLGAALIAAGYMVGLPTLTDKISDASVIKDRKLEIMQILPGKPAETAGLKTGDVITQIGTLKNPRLTEMQNYVNAHRAEEIAVAVQRGAETLTKNIKPIVYEETGRGGIGVGLGEFGTVKYPWYKALWQGLLDAFYYLKEIFVALYLLVVGLFAGKGAGEAVSGPIGIAIMTGEVARLGFIYLLQFTAVLSLNLAVVNILPIPALDGGRLLFLVLNRFKKINFAKYEQAAHSIGFVLLMLLIVVVTIKDIGTFKGVFISFWDKIF